MKTNKIEAIMLCLCLMMSFVFVNFALNPSPTSAVMLPTLYLDPTPVTVFVSDTFTVAVKIKNVTDLCAWEVKLSFDPDLLECLDATEGPFLSSVGPTIFLGPIINNTEGTIHVGCTLFPPRPGASGSGTLAYIKFHCDGPGECDLVFLYPPTGLYDSMGNPIPHNHVDGHVVQKIFTRYLHREEPLEPTHLHKEEPLEPVHLHKEEPLEPVHLHPMGPFDPRNPWFSEWHELHPQYCTYYILTSWEDTDQSGDLSPSDQIDLWNMETGETIWYHLDRLTWTIFIQETGPPPPFEPLPVPPLYAELEGPKTIPPPITDPRCTDWHVVYPLEQYSRRFHVWSWYDNDHDGYLSYCDNIDVEYRDKPGVIYYYHMEAEPALDLILTKKCFYNPVSTEWHELRPTFSQYYHISSWEDTNEDRKLSPSDQIDLHFDWPKFHHDNPLIGYSMSTAPNTNTTLWSYNTTAPVNSSPAIVDNILYIGSNNSIFYALDATTGAVIWTFPTGGRIMSSPAVFYGKVYFLSGDRNLYALDANTGALVWSTFIDTGPTPWSSPAVHMGRVFIADSSGWIHCLNAFNGAIIWSTFVGGNPNGPITVANNKVFSGTHNFDNSSPTLVALNELTGAIIWTYSYTVTHPGLVGMVNCNGAAVTDGDSDGNLEVYFGIFTWGGVGNTAIALDEATGLEIWTQNINGMSTSTPAVHNGKVFIGSDDFNVYALDAATGAYIWNYPTKGKVWSAPAVADGKVFATSLDHTLYALDETTGAFVWSYNTSLSRLYGSPAVACGRVYVGSENGKVYAFGPEESKVHWYHVDRVTVTITLKEKYVEPPMQPIQIYAEFEGSFDMFFEPIMNPVSTPWHVVYPPESYSRRFNITSWEDNGDGVFSYCDQIEVVYEDGTIRWYHVEEIACDIILTKKCFYDPIDTQWHELYPEYCRNYTLTSWKDTNMDDKLSPSDQIDLTDKETGKVTWYHVDRITLTIKIREKGVEPPVTLYAEFTGPLEMFFQPIMNPVCTYWHVVWPPENFSSIFHIGSWIDNGDRVLSYCDYIDVEYEDGTIRWYHVEEIACDIILTKKCFYEPIGSIWHELHPEYCRRYEMTSWKDTNRDSMLSPSDFIDLTDIKAGVVTWYHIDRVTPTIKIKEIEVGTELYAEFTGPFDQFFEPIMNPVCTIWHVIYPPENFSRYFHITSWIDNGDGVLSYCDQIDVEYEDGTIRWYHVEEIACDIVISCTGIVVAGSEDHNVYARDFLGNHLWTTPTVAPVLSVAMDNNGSYVAAGSRLLGTNTGALYFMDAFTGTILWSKDLRISESYDNGWMGTESKSVDVKYNSYNKYHIVAAAHDLGLNLYDELGNLIWTYWDEFPETIVRISQDGNYIICADYGGRVPGHSGRAHYFSHLRDGTPGWGPADGTPMWTHYKLDTDGVFWVAISGLGDYVAISGWWIKPNAYVTLLNRTGATVWIHTLTKGGYVRVDMPCDGKSVVAVNDDPTESQGCDLLYWNDGCNDWDSGDGTPIWNFWPGKPNPQVWTDDFYSVAISGNGDVIATGGIPQNVYLLWRDGTLLRTIADGTVQSLDLTFNGEYGVAGDRQNRVWFFRKDVGWCWNYPTGGIIHSVAISKIYPCMFPYPDHDVDVHHVKPLKNIVGQGYATKFNVTLSNEGAFAETAYLKIWAQNSTYTALVNSSLVTLASGTTPTIIVQGTGVSKLSKGNYTIFASISIVPNEIDVYDNTYVDGWVFVTIPGDINGDKTVNILDCIILAGHFGHVNGDGHTPCTKAWKDCWNSNINCDGTVNILDCIILAGRFGQRWL